MLRHVTSALGILIAADNIIVAEDTLYIAASKHQACRHQQPCSHLHVARYVWCGDHIDVSKSSSSDLPLDTTYVLNPGDLYTPYHCDK